MFLHFSSVLWVAATEVLKHLMKKIKTGEKSNPSIQGMRLITKGIKYIESERLHCLACCPLKNAIPWLLFSVFCQGEVLKVLPKPLRKLPNLKIRTNLLWFSLKTSGGCGYALSRLVTAWFILVLYSVCCQSSYVSKRYFSSLTKPFFSLFQGQPVTFFPNRITLKETVYSIKLNISFSKACFSFFFFFFHIIITFSQTLGSRLTGK